MRFLYRRHLALKLLGKISPESAIEIGFSTRDLLGATGIPKKIGIDLKEDVCKNAPFTAYNIDEKDFQPQENIDLVIALEVLEHIKDDVRALRRWKSWLNAGGHLLISVPARMKHWDDNDIFSEHVRRYEKKEIYRKLNEAGFEVVTFYSYGFPLYNALKKVGNIIMKRKLQPKQRAKDPDLRINPGTMTGLKKPIGMILSNKLSFTFHDLFLGADLGIGYMALVKAKD
jgi:SAM-dependent methyltransferase